MIGTYYGKPVEELTREELLECIKFMSDDILYLRKNLDIWMKSGDALKYLQLKYLQDKEPT